MSKTLTLNVEVDDVHEQMYDELTENMEVPIDELIGNNLSQQAESIVYELYQRSKNE